MGDRFYTQMLNKLGSAPGVTSKRKRRMAWTDEKKEAVIQAYKDLNPTPENSMECVGEVAEEFEESPNGVRTILSRAGVYIKKTPEAASTSGTKTTRVSKAASQEALADAIKDAGQEVDEDVISKLTGKAAQYLTDVITNITK